MAPSTGYNDIRFEPNDAAINSLAPGSRARVVLDLQLTTGNHPDGTTIFNVGNHFDATLFIEHNTSAIWDSNSSPNLFEETSSSTINDNPRRNNQDISYSNFRT